MTLARGLQRLVDWFWDDSLPLWRERAATAEGAFVETLSLAGEANHDEPRRSRVQARQIHVFATVARVRGDSAAERVARRGFEAFLGRNCPEQGERGAVHLLDPNGSVLDGRRDLYDQAFLLLACASVWRAFGDARALYLARRTLAFLDRELRSPDGGYFENDQGSGPRRQNPHMHLFEAFCALHAATSEASFLQRAAEVLELLKGRFLDHENEILREHLTHDLKSPDPLEGALIEPGHMAEWVWLLERYGRAASADVAILQTRLYRAAITHGEDERGFLVDALRLGERPHGPRRLWPQTEFLKAALVMARKGELAAAARATSLADAIFESYLDQPTCGLWCDRVNSSGEMLAEAVPASILYHVMEAALEAEAHLKETA
jgi:mannose-6-phosphate isomerase